MSKNTLHIHYIELPALDIAASKAFYSKAFGWTFEDWGPDYTAFEGAGLEGGLRKEETTPPHGGALVILYADDLQTAENAIVNAGGTITEHHEFPGGRRFHFTDPSGLELAVWTKVAP